jgi:hypothetical protein
VVEVPEEAFLTEYLNACRAEPENGLAQVASDIRLPPVHAQSYGKLLLDRSIFLAVGEAIQLGEDLRRLFESLISCRTDSAASMRGLEPGPYAEWVLVGNS